MGTEPGNLTHWEVSASSLNCNELAQHHRARSMPRSWLRGIELAQWHRAGSIFLAKKKRKKKTSQKLSQLRHVELADECESIKTNTNYVLAGFMTHWRAGSRACSRLNFCEVFFSAKKNARFHIPAPAQRYVSPSKKCFSLDLVYYMVGIA